MNIGTHRVTGTYVQNRLVGSSLVLLIGAVHFGRVLGHDSPERGKRWEKVRR
jgi:hypothetical protein